MRGRVIIIGTIMLVITLVVFFLPGEQGAGIFQSRLVAGMTPSDVSGFARAGGVINFNFPQDHGPHPEYQTEWWYYTGNLATSEGRQFGYQLTFFRRALLPPDQLADRESEWAADQVYMAHFALSDISEGEHKAFERFSRGAAGLAGSDVAPFQVWLGDWSVSEIVDADLENPVYKMKASEGDVSLDLVLTEGKEVVLQGEQGFSRKGSGYGQASYYYSLPRLETKGAVRVGGQVFDIQGTSWMDHEFSTSALSEDQVGWDWFSLQLANGSELMIYMIRLNDGSIEPHSSGSYIAPDGEKVGLEVDDLQITVDSTWESPHTGAIYPAGWILSVPKLELNLQVKPLMADQELNLSYSYWEGAVGIVGDQNGQKVEGRGYVELTGYADSMGGEF